MHAGGLDGEVFDYFPSFSEGLSLRLHAEYADDRITAFPFLFGGTFIEAFLLARFCVDVLDFPSFSEGLSLRLTAGSGVAARRPDFPSFSEGLSLRLTAVARR